MLERIRSFTLKVLRTPPKIKETEDIEIPTPEELQKERKPKLLSKKEMVKKIKETNKEKRLTQCVFENRDISAELRAEFESRGYVIAKPANDVYVSWEKVGGK